MQLLSNPVIGLLAFIPRSETHKNLDVNVLRSFINNKQKLEITQMSKVKIWKWTREESLVKHWRMAASEWWRARGEWFKNGYVVTICYYPAIQENRRLIHATTWSIFKWLCCMKKANPQWLHTVWFHLYKVLEMTKVEKGPLRSLRTLTSPTAASRALS